jgi:hypothetical protein
MYLNVSRFVYSVYQFILKLFLNFHNVNICNTTICDNDVLYRSITYKFSYFLYTQYVIFQIAQFTHNLGSLRVYFLDVY